MSMQRMWGGNEYSKSLPARELADIQLTAGSDLGLR